MKWFEKMSFQCTGEDKDEEISDLSSFFICNNVVS